MGEKKNEPLDSGTGFCSGSKIGRVRHGGVVLRRKPEKGESLLRAGARPNFFTTLLGVTAGGQVPVAV